MGSMVPRPRSGESSIGRGERRRSAPATYSPGSSRSTPRKTPARPRDHVEIDVVEDRLAIDVPRNLRMRGEGLDPRCEHRARVDGAEVDRLDPEAVRGQEQFPLLLVENGERPVASELAQEGRSLFAESSDDRLSVEAAGPGNEEAIVLMGARSRRCQCAALTDNPKGGAGARGFPTSGRGFPGRRWDHAVRANRRSRPLETSRSA